MAKELAAAVEPWMINRVNKAVNDHDLAGLITGIGKQLKTTRDNISIACAAIVLNAVANKTSKYMNALVDVLVEHKRNDDAKAVITWAEAHGFKAGTHPVTKKKALEFDVIEFKKYEEEIAKDKTEFITRLMSKPYHISIKKADPFADIDAMALLAAASKKLHKAKDEYEAREAAGVKTSLRGLDKIDALIKELAN